ncbi:MAG TPA: DnaJ domain-containing protein [Candidatus Sulfotelmatobacter sp.]|nr:DnaJ domain-containing protein [Candidatus Sulfotelmatobacter sp.]
MAVTEDLYQLLQVAPNAEPEVVRAAYRALAQKHHPDAGGSQEAMAILNRAWAVLGDAQARAHYDRQRTAATERATAKAEAAAAQAQTSPRPTSTVLDYGRYQGWSLADLARHDPDYLAWLARTPSGRGYKAEIDALLAGPGAPTARPFQGRAKSGLFGRVARAG